MEFTILLMGASGDLARRKIIPALYELLSRTKGVPFILIGAAYESITADQMLESAKPFITNFNVSVWKRLKRISSYQQMDMCDISDYEVLYGLIQREQTKHRVSEPLMVYCAVPSTLFSTITHKLASVAIFDFEAVDQESGHMMVYEKPFGHDARSAMSLYQDIGAIISDEQIHLVDHFLAKPMVRALPQLREDIPNFEALLNAKHIDHIQIILNEDMGIGNRGRYYDAFGALSDVVQNHMVEMLAMLGADFSSDQFGSDIQKSRALRIDQLRITDGLRGQYESYQQEEYVAPDSTTETYAVLRLELDNDRWRAMPWFIKTGKMLATKQTAIYIQFKQRLADGSPDYLLFDIYPDGTISFSNSSPHATLFTVVRDSYHKHGNATASDYASLMSGILKGDQSVTVNFDEIEKGWKFIDMVKKKQFPLVRYKDHSKGPEEAELFAKKYGINWYA